MPTRRIALKGLGAAGLGATLARPWASALAQSYPGKTVRVITPFPAGAGPDAAMRLLMRHDYPGNVRELENILERSLALADSDRIDASAANVDYDMKNETMVFTGNVVIKQSRGSINGERVVYNLKSGQLQSGGEGGGRVKMRILPKDTAASSAQSSAKGNP